MQPVLLCKFIWEVQALGESSHFCIASSSSPLLP